MILLYIIYIYMLLSIYYVLVYYIIGTCFGLQQDESGPGTQPTDMEGDVLIQMVNKAVSSIMTRLQSEFSSTLSSTSV